MTASYRNRHMIELVVILAYHIITILKRACLKNNCILLNDRLKQNHSLNDSLVSQQDLLNC